MFTRTKNRKGLSTVIVTLIILVASVVLGTGVVLYGTSLFQTGAQSQSISTQGTQVWVNTTNGKANPGWTWGAAAIRNDGDKILSVDTISVRGTQVPFSNWYYDSNSARVTSANFQAQLNYTGVGAQLTGIMDNSNTTVLTAASPAGCSGTGATFAINEFGKSSNPTLCFLQASGPVSLKPGDKAIIYFQIPTGILSSVDAGSSSSVALYAGKVGAPVTVTVQSKS